MKKSKINSKQETTKKNINMHNKIDSNNKVAYQKVSKEILPILPLIIIVFLLPFIIRLKIIPLDGVFYDYWTGERNNFDFFTYYKKVFIYIITIWTLLHTFFFVKKFKRTKAYYFIGVYAILVVLSTIFSDYPEIALHGFVERHEGMWVVLSYIILMFSAINLINTDNQIKTLIYSIGLSGGIISVISILQFFGLDIFETSLVTNLMVSKDTLERINELDIRFGEGYSYGVFYNPNYLGSYLSFYGPLMLGYSIYSKGKERFIFGFLFVISILALVFSRSEAAILGVFIAILVIVLFIYIKSILKKANQENRNKVIAGRLMPIILAIIIIPVSLSYFPMERNPLERIRKESVQLVSGNKENLDYREIGPLNDIQITEDNKAIIKVDNKEISIKSDEKNIIINDFNNSEIYNRPISEKVDNIPIGEGLYEKLLLTTYLSNDENISALELYFIEKSNIKVYFMVRENQLNIVSSTFKDIEIADAPYIGFHGNGKLGSNRGYIWSRSLPLVIKNIIIGSGPDTFVTQFPQYDIFARQIEFGYGASDMWRIVDKPHNLYLHMGVQSGFISLIIFIIGIGIIMFKNYKRYIKTDENIYLVLSSSLLGFFISSIFNDSIVGILPIVMIIIGISIGQIEDFENQDKGGKLDAK